MCYRVTRFRYPQGWNTKRAPGERPDLSASWLRPDREPGRWALLSRRRSYQYWTQIHWATPPWMTDEMWVAVRKIYESATPGFDEVDHIVPLKHPLVCGLNVPWNMRRETVRYNQSKSNNYWPDCPDHLCPERNLPADMFGDHIPHQTRLAL